MALGREHSLAHLRARSSATWPHFGIESVTDYLSSGPPDLTSAEYADAFNEVKTLGSFTDTDPERAAIARHWLAEGGTVRETGCGSRRH